MITARVKNEIAARFVVRRVALGCSQLELANALSLKRQTISDIENGVRSIRAEELHDVATQLEVTITWLITGLESDTGGRRST